MATLQEIINYSKANPNTDYAKRAYEFIQAGKFDEQSQKEGVDLSWAGRPPLQKTEPIQDRNIIQKGLGLFLDPIIESGVRVGQAIGASALTLAGGDPQKIEKALSQPTRVPIIGTEVKPSTQETSKNVAGRAISTVALGMGSPALAGGALGAGSALEEDAGATETAVKTVVGAIGGKILEYGFNAVSPYIEKAALKYGQPIIDKLASYVPETATKTFQNIAEKVGAKIPDITSKELPGGRFIQKGQEALTTAEKKAGEFITEKVSGVTKKFMGKTQTEILATPESELSKLSPAERKIYFDAKKQVIEEKSILAEKNIVKGLQSKAEASQIEAEKLQRELATATRDKVVELRPKIRSALGRQSQEYRRLVAEELSTKGDIKINSDELRNFVDTKYPENPDLARAIKSKYEIPESGETTIKNIYDKIQSLGQEISGAAKKGTRVYTSDEKLTDDAIHTLTDFMKSKGVDLTQARQFWAKYAPIRNQIVSESKPFLQTETQTKTFAGTLSRVASGKDVNNEKFIGEVENLLGQSITKEAKSIVAKLTANEKQIIADKIESEVKKEMMILEKEKALKQISDKEFETNRKSRSREIIKKIIYTMIGGGLGAAGYETVKKMIP